MTPWTGYDSNGCPHQRRHYEYDDAGNPIAVTDRKGQVTTFTYDALNRRTQVIGMTTPRPPVSTYDAGNRLIQIVDSLRRHHHPHL